ncbi:acetolactate synthase, small subunit [Lachnospiraceae bacterium NK3A20]|jgi:acetolactate synthase-1/3 small subunit|nr:acetolactate synthase, small subunit [Lachnospiraceae bacterium NK3A20]
MKRIYSVLVENRAGVLCKVAGLFWRRCFNIDSLAVGETDDHTVSNMVIVSSGDRRTLEQIEKQLNKKLDVIKVKTFDETQALSRELMLMKVKYNRNNRRDIMENCTIMGAQIVDMSNSLMTIQICDTPERVDMFLNTFKTISIVELTRTGTLAVTKCSEA